MKTSDFDFDLPPDLIAQAPLPERSASRMLVVDRASQTWSHRCVTDLPPIVQPGDVMVVNDTRVFPARLLGAREDTGGRVELLLVEEVAPHIWECFFRASSSARPGMRLVFGDRQLVATIQDRGQGGRVRAELATEAPLFDVLESIGVPPVPPYIKRDDDHPEQVAMDRNRYQTVYARERGAVAAPTAGLHLDRQLLDKLQERGIERVPLTLHVGPGTFKPVSVDDVEAHTMESERYVVSTDAERAVNQAKASGKQVLAVGSTSVRTLETVASQTGHVEAGSGRSDIFIYPPYEFRIVDMMLTNFHLPRSSLIMMVSALAGYDLIMAAYAEAVRERYRFYSYGDCMLIV